MLEDSTHGDYSNTSAILAGINSSVKTFGYVNLGNTNNYTIAEVKSRIDKWIILNIKGIFLDEAGFDYWNGTDNEMRVRQNQIVDYIHSKNLTAILNVWEPDDVFVKESGTPTTIAAGDYILYESYQFSTAATLNLTNHLTKINKLIAAKKSHNIKIMAINTTSSLSSNFVQAEFDYMTILAQTEGVDALAWGTAAFSASGADNGVMPFRSSDYNNSNFFGNRSVKTSDNTITQIYKGGVFNLDFDNKTFSTTAP